MRGAILCNARGKDLSLLLGTTATVLMKLRCPEGVDIKNSESGQIQSENRIAEEFPPRSNINSMSVDDKPMNNLGTNQEIASVATEISQEN